MPAGWSKDREQFRGTPSQAKTGPKFATAAWLAKAQENRKNSHRFGAHSENLGYVYFLY
jgi:hypothetical protein